jgi:hypothetical protein
LLIAQRNAGAHTGINKKIVATSKPALQSIQRIQGARQASQIELGCKRLELFF